MTPRIPRTKKAPSASAGKAPAKSGRGHSVRTEGQRLLQAIPSSLSLIAAQLAASKATVGDWRTGLKIPGPAFREKLCETYAIPIDAWDRNPSGPPVSASTAPVVPSSAGGTPSTLEDVESLIAVARTSLSNESLVSSERVKLTDSLTRLLSLKHKLERDRDALEDTIVRRHPLWQRIRTILVETLVGFPDAAQAVAAKLDELDL